jgi:hypothetical protein
MKQLGLTYFKEINVLIIKQLLLELVKNQDFW